MLTVSPYREAGISDTEETDNIEDED